jgi:ferredoxin
VCEPECPIEAILPDLAPGAENFLELNREYSLKWPNITRRKDPLADADDWANVPDKMDKHFSDRPGEGD